MAGRGGARPNSGPKKGQHRIECGELRRQLEAKLGMSYAEMLGLTQLKLFNDFNNDINVKEFIRFTENMSNRILINQANDVNITNTTSDLTPEELQARIDNLMTRHVLSLNKQSDDGNSKTD